MNIEELNSLPQNKPLDGLIENYTIQLFNTDKPRFYKNLYKFLYSGQFDENELSEQELRILEEIKEYGKLNEIPVLDSKTYDVFAGICVNKEFTLQKCP